MISTIFKVLFWGLLVVVTYLTVAPNPPETGGGNAAIRLVAQWVFGDAAHGDKVGHFAAYGTLGLAFVAAGFRRWNVLVGALVLALYGAALEVVQYFLDARSADIWDGVANATGAMCGVVAGTLLLMILQRNAGSKS